MAGTTSVFPFHLYNMLLIPRVTLLLRKKKLDQSVANMIARDMRPVAIVDGKGFRSMWEEAVPGYTLPARKTLTTKIIPSMVKQEKTKLKEEIKGTDHLSITSDAWTDNSSTPYLAVSGHFISDEKYLKSKCLDCSM